jgi:hypothetical protein
MVARVTFTTVAFLALTGLAEQKVFGAITGTLDAPVLKVNGSVGTHFNGPGDYFFFADVGVCGVGAGDPATPFHLVTSLLGPAGLGPLTTGSTNVTIQPGGAGGPNLGVGYTVPEDYYPYYDVYFTLTYYDTANAMFVYLDAEYGQYYTD